MNNPSSAFGHSLFRFNKGQGSELLDYAINFSADVDTSNAFLYGVKGLLGLFPGTFKVMPYYLMVRKYNSFESRDLWSYELELSKEELQQVVDHIWELGSTHFDYFYLSENCSFALLATLEAAVPRFQFTSQMAPIVIPVDTLKIVSETEGLVRSVAYRPSEREKFRARWNHLTKEERQTFIKAIQKKDTLSEQLDSLSVPHLDLLIDYYDYKYPKEIHRPDTQEFKLKKQILSARSKRKEITPEIQVPDEEQERPDLSHDSSRFSLGGLYDDQLGSGVRIKIRTGLHDLLDPRTAYPHYAQIDFLSAQSSFFPNKTKFVLDHFDLVKIQSLLPTESYDFQFSWAVQLGGRSIREKDCQLCFAGVGKLGGGLSHSIFEKPSTDIFYLFNLELVGNPALSSSGLRFGIGPRLGVRSEIHRRLNLLAEIEYQYLFNSKSEHNFKYSGGVRWSPLQILAVDLQFEGNREYWSAGANTHFYF